MAMEFQPAVKGSRTGVLMPRFKIGDRVELVGDIAQFYTCIVGVIAKAVAHPGAILNQYTVLLADGIIASFFDFQLQTPPAVVAHVMFDSAISSKSVGIRGPSAVRQVRLFARDLHIQLRISGSASKTIVGQVAGATRRLQQGLVVVLSGDEILDSTSSDASGKFTLYEVPAGKMRMEIFIPSRRIIVNLDV
jgi:hypothetical protein